LCNGTRLCVKNLCSHLIEATILIGCAKGKDVFIPRIPLIPTDLPFDFKRIHFPVRLVFAMSINKAQGQSLKIAGIHLQNPCFSHGQIYVTCSRVRHPTNLHILAPGGKTRNIVHLTALQWHFSQNITTLFLEQYIPFTDDAVPLNVHMSALFRNPGAFCRQHSVYFTVKHFHNFCSPFSLYQKITPSIGFHDWSSRATPGTPASLYISTKLTGIIWYYFS
jgi:ATP-dependent DNA helicase PIF1